MRRTLLLFICLLTLSVATAQNKPMERLGADGRPVEKCFTAESVEHCIARVSAQLTHPKLRAMFVSCFPNTLDTTVRYSQTDSGDDDTFVITGDIHALWLRDSGAQVWPYLRFAKGDEGLRRLIRGVIRRQLRCLLIDPYANAFMESPDSLSTAWRKDYTQMLPGVFERKYELDSPCYVIRLAYAYWQQTGDATIFDATWTAAMERVVQMLREQQGGDTWRYYKFQRTTHAMHDTRSNYGKGHPGKPCGLIASAFRPSDDCTLFPYLIPSNFMARDCMRKAAEIFTVAAPNAELKKACSKLAAEIDEGLKCHATVEHPQYGRIYAYETDGYGSHLLMDDANVPSLLALPYISDVDATDSIWLNTRRFCLSADNPYYFSGKAGSGIGGPHVGLGYVWPMSLIMQAMTSESDEEIRQCLLQLISTDAGTGFIHESFNCNDANDYTRSWFAWANTLFGELILNLIDRGKLPLLNNLQ